MTKRWYTTQEVADLLGLTSESVRRLIYARRLAAVVYTGGARPTIRISDEALASYRRTYARDSMRDDWE
jgi:excisionase family DNA binding protein